MRMLEIRSDADRPSRYNYLPNYGFCDAMQDIIDIDVAYSVTDLVGARIAKEYDIVMIHHSIRWRSMDKSILYTLKDSGGKLILIDGDCSKIDIDDSFYDLPDYIFYRCPYRDGKIPINGSLLLWSVNEDVYTEDYGGNRIVFNASFSRPYHTRRAIRDRYGDRVYCTQSKHETYRENLRGAVAAFTTGGQSGTAKAKTVEIAASGTAIITDRCQQLYEYFPENLYYIFDTLDDIDGILSSIEANPSVAYATAMRLRKIVELKHTDKIRAMEVINTIEAI